MVCRRLVPSWLGRWWPISGRIASDSPSASEPATQTRRSDLMPTENSQLDQIGSTLQSIQTTLNSGRLFDVLEAVRDQVRDLKNQNQQIRNDIMDVQRIVFEQNAKSSAAD
jgi:hypothetical protein